MESGDTWSASYTARLTTLESPLWKRVLNIQAPYRWDLRRLLGDRVTLDVGCGVGRNLQNLPPGSVGVDHNMDSLGILSSRIRSPSPSGVLVGAGSPTTISQWSPAGALVGEARSSARQTLSAPPDALPSAPGRGG
jgi:hypothetical protein